MKKLILIGLILFNYSLLQSQIEPLDTDGNGYRNMKNLEHFKWLSVNSKYWSGKYELDNNINAAETKNWNNGQAWIPIGNDKTHFTGSFNGKGFTIDSLFFFAKSHKEDGFWGIISSGCEISNLNLTNVNIILDGTGVGYTCAFLVVNCKEFAKISNCKTSCNIISENKNFGIIVCGLASSNGGTIVNSYSDITFIEKYVDSLNYPKNVIFGFVQGNGFEIDNCHCKISAPNCSGNGLVGSNGGKISNSTSNVNISNQNTVGGIASKNYGVIINCSSSGFIDGGYYAGGLVGKNETPGSYISHSFSNCIVQGYGDVGGLVGKNEFDMLIKDCYFIGLVNLNYRPTGVGGFAGGLVGLNYGHIDSCFSKGNVHSNSRISSPDTDPHNGLSVGGLVGMNYGGLIENSFANCSVSGYAIEMGGLVGNNTSPSWIENCHSEGEVFCYGTYSPSYYNPIIGGLVGKNGNMISKCYSFTNVRDTIIHGKDSQMGQPWTGGLVGVNLKGARVENSFARGNVIANGLGGGGLFGANQMYLYLINCYSTGFVSGESGYLNGLSGGIASSIYVTSSYWDIETSGLTTSDIGLGLTTNEMKTLKTYTDGGWDFENIWKIEPKVNDGYPYLLNSRITNVKSKNNELIDIIHIYPNPSNDYIEISIMNKGLKPSAVIDNIKIFNMLGIEVMNIRTGLDLSLQRIDISYLPAGIYYIKIGEKLEKFVKM